VTTTPDTDGRTVLLVDDNETTRYVFGLWLRRAGFAVVEASSGAEAIDLLATVTPDVAVLDVNLPDMSGFDVLDHVKAGDPSVPVLHVSATAVEVADRSQGLQRGADGYLVEPVERDELLASIQSLLRYSSARRRAERLSNQMLALNDAIVAVHAATTVDELCLVAALGASRILGRRLAVAAHAQHEGRIALAELDGTALVAGYRPGALSEPVGGLSPLAGVITSTRLPDFVPPPELAGLLSTLHGREIEAIVTRHVRGTGVAGLLIDGSLTEESDQVLASQIARSLAVAVDNLRLFEIERGLAVRLQHALLPDRLPVVPGLEVATRYLASEDHAEIGGDFYEAFAIDDTRVALAIGDVGGHSLEAAAVMGELRAGLRAYTIEGLDPEAVVSRLNRLLGRFWPTMIATAFCTLLDTRTRRLTAVNAGHLPLLILSGGEAWWLTGGSTLLGVDGREPANTTIELPPAAAVVFATDGLVERRDRYLDDSLQEMAEAARDSQHLGPDGICRAVIDVCRPTSGAYDDDVALMVVQLCGESADPAGGPPISVPRVLDGTQLALEAVPRGR
jgi:serine phosphatase RsbU (regulator of sigma subunit)/CheY-like chemotaxis protein